tara:strand:- start:129 stop:266 length:138 start_codon:yes stop_codon:yes gene_type:complete
MMQLGITDKYPWTDCFGSKEKKGADPDETKDTHDHHDHKGHSHAH